MKHYDFRLSVIQLLLKKQTAPNLRPSSVDHLLEIWEQLKAGKVFRKPCKNYYLQGRRKYNVYVYSTCRGNPG